MSWSISLDGGKPRRYELILTMLEQLEELGERITDVEGYALHIKGTTFEISPTSGVQEV